MGEDYPKPVAGSYAGAQLSLLPHVHRVYDNVGRSTALPTVGRSDRTPGKHSFLNASLGWQCGVMSRRFSDRPFLCHDLTAGDGRADGGPWDQTCSPGIFTKHIEWCARHGVNAGVHLSEMNPRTWEELRENLKQNLTIRGWDIREGWHADETTRLVAHFPGSKVAFLEAALRHTPARRLAIGRGQVGFVFHDPNAVTQADFPAAFLPGSRDLLMVLMTMGMNAGGLKRLAAVMSPEERRAWTRRIDAVRGRLHGHQDLALIRLVGDSHQWVYVTVVPRSWRPTAHQLAERSFSRAGFPIEITWLRDDPTRFEAIYTRLHLTNAEMSA